MKIPVLDDRTKENIVKQMTERAASYTPEWHCNKSKEDPGAALFEIFSDMYIGTLDRFNKLPKKYYTEFLNIIGASKPDAASSFGYVRFDVHPKSNRSIPIPEKTLIAAPVEDKDSVMFETVERIEASPAMLSEVFFCDAKNDVLQKLDLSKGAKPLFAANESENLCGHTLILSQNQVLRENSNSTITVELHQSASFKDQALLNQLCDAKKATWSWLFEDKKIPFSSVKQKNGIIYLQRNETTPFSEDENGKLCIYCDLKHPEEEIILESASLSSIPKEDLVISEMSFNDFPLEQGSGYCFGRTPSIYDLLYFRCDGVFCKKGALVALNLKIATEIENPMGDQKNYDWTQNVINKNDVTSVIPDDVVVLRVIWEYFNGNGWAVLPVSGDVNPFLPVDKESIKTLSFEIPDDITPVIVNAKEGFYVRARIAEMKNALSLKPRWMLPYMKKASCRWQYLSGSPVDYIASVNDATPLELTEVSKVQSLKFKAFYPMMAMGKNLYFCFDASPNALPLTMFFQLLSGGKLNGKLVAEALDGKEFSQLRITDGTGNLSSSGIVRLYIPKPLEEKELFGLKGFWIRFRCEGLENFDNKPPQLLQIHINSVMISQKQQAENQYFDTKSYDKNKSIQLLYTPVQGEEIWIDETGKLSKEEILTLGKNLVEKDEKQFVLWKRSLDLRLSSGNDRVYELDAEKGIICFGDNIHGKIPPEGGNNICVSYSYGGGSLGNFPIGSVKDLIASIPMIDSVQNVTQTCGGTDRGNDEWLENVGMLRLRHQGKALGVKDYEALVLEHFPRVFTAKAFSGFDENAQRAMGHLTLVFLCAKASNQADNQELALQIYNYISRLCDCTLLASGRLHIIPAMEITISVEVQVELLDLNTAADTQQLLSDEITKLINEVWRLRGIGEKLHIEELYQLISQAPNVALLRSMLVEGSWSENGIEKSCNLEEEHNFLYSAVKSGLHSIRIQ